MLVVLGCYLLWRLAQIEAQTVNVEYGKRSTKPRGGERYEEGITRPFYATDHVELIGAMVHEHVPVNQIPETLTLDYKLPYKASVHLLVQELEYSRGYQMYCLREMGTKPPFEWPGTVIQALDEMEKFDLDNLTAVARLNQKDSAPNQEVAPVVFYRTENAKITGKRYLFIFRPAWEIMVTSAAIYKLETPNSEPVKQLLTNETRPGEQWFWLVWDGGGASTGYYQVKLTGYATDTNRLIDQTVKFYHEK